MKKRVVFVIIFGISMCLGKAEAAFQKFEKSAFYSVMASGDIDAIDKQLDIVENSSISEKEGYEGALLMRKAGIVKKAKEKLILFKKGRIKLETALLANNENIEFHFLRLAIEEHAPKIVKYRADIEKDKLLVIKNFKNLAPAVQNAIVDYCKTSKVLHKEDL
jgi:hypothetical protein